MKEDSNNIKIIKSTCYSEDKTFSKEILTSFLPDETKDVKAVCWLHHKLCFLDSNELAELKEENFNQLVRLRVFNQSKELHVWQSGTKLKYRIREDDIGDTIEYMDSELIMNGTTSKPAGDNHFLVTEDRGVAYQIPKEWLDESFELKVTKPKKRLKLKTRNYIGYNDLGQAGYIDCRFVEIINK